LVHLNVYKYCHTTYGIPILRQLLQESCACLAQPRKHETHHCMHARRHNKVGGKHCNAARLFASARRLVNGSTHGEIFTQCKGVSVQKPLRLVLQTILFAMSKQEAVQNNVD
jgi:hypothetical protein